MRELNNNIFNNNIAGDTSNILIPDNSAIKKGVVFKSNIDSNVLNGFYNIKMQPFWFFVARLRHFLHLLIFCFSSYNVFIFIYY